jgi:hypothetical protein
MGHPLFPIDPQKDDEHEKDIAHIRVTRWARGNQKWYPRLFGADEMRTQDRLVELFGGGSYELIALDATAENIVARNRFTLPGKPIPFDGDEDEERAEKRSGAAAGGITSEQILLAVMQQQSSQQKEMMGFFSAVMEASKAESRAVMEASKADARAMVESAKAESRAFAELHAKSNENQTRMMTEFFNKSLEMSTKTVGTSGGENASGFTATQMFELGGALAEAKAAGGIDETLHAVLDTFKHAVDAKKAGNAAPPANDPNGGQ